ncbi:glycosyltransferase family 9 protein [uncultured Nisaea sp.]|uniref:glycosyltransferase family 9 protein n=1 Tax=uncultured Nisaea sp. TaxID=538215 RepID=UPI0030EDA9AB
MEAETAGANPRPIGGTLVIQPLPGIGDAIWHLPHLKSIAAQTKEKTVTLLTKKRSRADSLFQHMDCVRDVLWLDEKRDRGPLGGFLLGAALRPYDFTSVWILHTSPRYGLATWRAGIKERAGYGIGWQDAFLTSQHSLSRNAKNFTAIEKANQLLLNHSVPKLESMPQIQVPAPMLEETRQQYASLPRPWFSFIIGASEAFKQWGADNFGALADRVRRETGGTIFLIGGPGESDIADRLQTRFGRPDWIVPVLTLPIFETGAVIAATDLAVGNDTGFLNLAAATGVQSVGLFGGSPPMMEDSRIDAITPYGELRYGSERMVEISPDQVAGRVFSNLAAD